MKPNFPRFAAMAFAAIIATTSGCRPHFTVQSAPMAPDQLGAFRVERPEVPAIVQFPNFTVGEVDTQYSDEEKELFRRHISVALPNALQDVVGKKQAFSAVTRVVAPAPSAADYIVHGDYDFFERLGTGGREWIPFYGTFGGKINEAHIKGNLKLRITEAKSGGEVFRRDYPEEHQDRTSVYTQPKVGYLQADYLGGIASDVTTAIRQASTGRPDSRAAGSVDAAAQPAVSAGDSKGAEARLRELKRLHQEKLISDSEYEAQRRKILDRMDTP